MKYLPGEHNHIVHIYRRDQPEGTERALCGWEPPDTWRPKNGRPAPLTALPDCERCAVCLNLVARRPNQLYALMPPEDWIDWEGAAMAEQTAISEQDLSSDPLAPAPRKPKVGATIAQASTRGRRRWNQKAWWVLSFGLIVLAIAVAAVSSGGSDNSSTNPSDNSSTTASDGHGASSGNEATPKQSKPESAPAGSGSRGELPLRDGDWRLDHITVGKNGHGDFLGNASIAYMGANPNGEDNIFTVTLFKGGKEVGILQGQSNVISRQDGATVQLASADAWVSGPYIYEFRAEL